MIVLLRLELKNKDAKSLKSYVIIYIYTYKSFIYSRIYKVAFLPDNFFEPPVVKIIIMKDNNNERKNRCNITKQK